MAQTTRHPDRPDADRIERILVIRLGALGDVVRTLPAVRVLRARHPGLPWLLCTGYAESTTVARAKAGGASAVLRKPIERDELRAAVSAALRPRN